MKPIDYKVEQIKIKNKDKKIVVETNSDIKTYVDIIKKVYGKMYIAFYGKKANVKMIDPKSDESWYKYVSVSKQRFISNGIQEDELYEHIVAHTLEELITQDKLIILNNIFNDIDYKELIEKFNYDDIKIFENDIKGYFQKSIFDYQGNKFILLFNDSTDDNVSLFIIDEANKLIEQPNEMFKTLLKKGEFAVNFSKKYSCSNIACSNINIQYGALKKINKGSQKNTFKTFNIMESFRGKDCANQTVHKTREETRTAIENMDNFIENKDIDTQYGLCSIYEIVLRHYNKNKKDNKIWFFTDVEHELSKTSLEKKRKAKK